LYEKYFPFDFHQKVFELVQSCALLLINHLHKATHIHPHFGFFKKVGELDLENWELWSLTTTPHFTIIVLLDGQFAAMCPKSKHLKHFVFKVLVCDLGVEVEGLETLWLEVVSFEKLEGKVFV